MIFHQLAKVKPPNRNAPMSGGTVLSSYRQIEYLYMIVFGVICQKLQAEETPHLASHS